MIFDRGGESLQKSLPNGLKVSLELFRVRDFNRVDRVERVEVGELNHEIHETHESSWMPEVRCRKSEVE